MLAGMSGSVLMMIDGDARFLHPSDGRGRDVRGLRRVEQVGEAGRDLTVVLAGQLLLEGVVAGLVLVGLGLGLDPAEHPLLALHRLVAGELGRLADELLADHLDEVGIGLLGVHARRPPVRARSPRPSRRSRCCRSRRRRCRRWRSPGTTASVVGAPTTANGSRSMALSASAWAAVASSGPPLASIVSTRTVRP